MCRFVFYKGRSSFLWLYLGRTFDKLFVAPLFWPSAFFQPHYPSFSSFTEDNNRGSHSSPSINGQLNLPHIVNVASKLSFSYRGSASTSSPCPEIPKWDYDVDLDAGRQSKSRF